MQVYIVLENNIVHNSAYGSFSLAIEAITEKHTEEIEEERRWQIEEDFPIESFIDVPENKETGVTQLFIEHCKINIMIHRLNVVV